MPGNSTLSCRICRRVRSASSSRAAADRMVCSSSMLRSQFRSFVPRDHGLSASGMSRSEGIMSSKDSAGVLVFGSINIDLVAEVPKIPRAGETVLATGGSTLFGGKGANQAVAAARVRDKTATTIMMAGVVGDDAYGADCIRNLAANRVDIAGVHRGQRPTGCAFIVVDGHGENAIA